VLYLILEKLKINTRDLIDNNIEWEEEGHTEDSQCNCSHEKSWDS
jgi:hypothetical protein